MPSDVSWPNVQDGVMRLSAAEFSALLEGLDWRRVLVGFRVQIESNEFAGALRSDVDHV